MPCAGARGKSGVAETVVRLWCFAPTTATGRRGMPSSPRSLEMLSVFWSAEQLTRWKSVLAAGVGPDATEVPENLLTVDPMIRGLWNKGQFTLKPALPPSPRNLDSSDRGTALFDCRAMEIIGTGHVIILTTEDPDTLPLPSMDLLECNGFFLAWWHPPALRMSQKRNVIRRRSPRPVILVIEWKVTAKSA
ncbi:hypothetical protein BJX65DRAFT_313887 [Aspergillus insuetus]